MRRIVALLFLFAMLFSFQPAQAQSQPKLDSVDVWVWPEYDQPSVLVIYHMTVSADTPLPTTMTFRIPAAAGKPSVVAVGTSASSVTDTGVKYSQEPNGDWLNIAIEVTGPAIQLEYYDPGIIKEGKNRNFVFEWPGDYAVNQFRIEVQQPFDASNLNTDPALNNVNTTDMTYRSGNFGPFAAGQAFTLKASYQKQSDEMSVNLKPVQTAAPVDANTAGRVSWSTYLPWLLAGVGVLLVAGGLYYFFRGPSRPKQVRRRHAAQSEPEEGPKYCSQCGTRSRPGDRFCRTCGTRIRQGNEE